VVGVHVALSFDAPAVIAIFMGMLTAIGGEMIRDMLTGSNPVILSAGELYATAVLGGACLYVLVAQLPTLDLIDQLLGILTVLILRAASIIFGLRVGPPMSFCVWGAPPMIHASKVCSPE
jgi:uncharacterized membrane protein YeiH